EISAGTRAWHRSLYVTRAERDSVCPDAQPQAQQGAARARDPADTENRRCAIRPQRAPCADRAAFSDLLARGGELRLARNAERGRGIPPLRSGRAELSNDGNLVLYVARVTDCRQTSVVSASARQAVPHPAA